MFIQIVAGVSVLCAAYIYYCRRQNAAFIGKEGEEANKNNTQEYTDAFNDFNKEDTDIRVVAVVRLAEVAQHSFYGKDDLFSKDVYPFFCDTAQQFIDAINSEKNLEVLSAIRGATIRMTLFANWPGRLDLLWNMMGKCANANHIAFHTFMEALASYLLTKSEEEKPELIKQLAVLAPFCDDNECLNQEILETICATEEFQKITKILETFQRSWSEQEKANHTEAVLLSKIQDKANRLMMTRDALVLTLQRERQSSNWRFEEQFLAGANFSGIGLESVVFNKAILIGAKFVATDMTLTFLKQANLTGADLTGANLSLAILDNANLSHANFTGADFSYADLTSVIVAESSLDRAKITNGTWKKANFEQNNQRDDDLYQKLIEKYNDVPDSVEDEEKIKGKHPMFKYVIYN